MLISAKPDVAYEIAEYIENSCGTCYVYNFASYYEGAKQLNLSPDYTYIASMGNPQIGTAEFEDAYAQQILGNQECFFTLVWDIVRPLYNNEDVIILASNLEATQYLSECLISIIQKRYRYRGYIDAESVQDYTISKVDGFSGAGIRTALQDIQWATPFAVSRGLIRL